MKHIFILLTAIILVACGNQKKKADNNEQQQKQTVTAENFIRAETDNMFVQMIKNAGGTNRFFHFRLPTPLDKQTVIRMNRDVLYSGGVFDAKEGLKVTFPEMPDQRYASVYVIDNDHYVQEIFYQPGQYEVNGNTRFLYIIVRIQVYEANNGEEIAMVNGLQDKFVVTSLSNEEFPPLKWDKASLDALRAKYNKESRAKDETRAP